MPTPNPKMFADDADARAASWTQLSAHMALIYQPEDIIEFRCLALGKETKHLYATLNTLAGIHDELCDLNDQGYNIYHGANPRIAEGGTKACDVAIARALFIDIDNGCTPQALAKAVKAAKLPKLSTSLHSGGGSQGVWVLKEAIPVDVWSGIQRGINNCVEGADGSINDAPRIMRPPGFINRKAKYAPDFPMATTATFNNGKHDHSVFPVAEAFTPAMQANGEPEKLNIDTTGVLPAWCDAFLADGTLLPGEGNAVPSRRGTAYRAAMEMQAAGFTIDDARDRIGSQLRNLGLDDNEMADVLCRQIPNAFSQQRSPTLDAPKLPTTIPSTPPNEPTVEIQFYDSVRVKVICRRGACVAIDVVDPTKASQRQKFLNRAAEELGEGTDTEVINARLKAVALGEEQPVIPEGADLPIGDAEEVDAATVVRPERYVIREGDSVVSAFTVPVLQSIAGEVDARWMTYVLRDGERSADPPTRMVEVGGSVFSVAPDLPGAPPDDAAKAWSMASRKRWLAEGGFEIEPAQMVDELVAAVDRFIEFPPGDEPMAMVVALFAVLTHNAPLFPCYPYILSTAPAGSGKSRTLEVLAELAFRTRVVSQASSPSMFREIHGLGVTMLLDEAQDVFKDSSGHGKDVHDLVLAGYKRGKTVPRCVGDDNEVVRFHCGGPKALASTEMPDPVLASRCIHVVMLRASGDSSRVDTNPDDAEHVAMWARLRDAIYCWSINSGHFLVRVPNRGSLLPKGLLPRTKEIWSGLFQIAWVLEQQGATGILDRLRDYVLHKEAQTSDVRVSPSAEAVIRALALLRIEAPKQYPTAGQIAARASDFTEGIQIHPRTVANILPEYSLPFRKQLLHGRRVCDQPIKRILEVAWRYELRLFDVEKEQQLAEAYGVSICPLPASDLPTHPDLPTPKRLGPEENPQNAESGLPTPESDLPTQGGQTLPTPGGQNLNGVGKPQIDKNAVSPVLESNRGGQIRIGGQIQGRSVGIAEQSDDTADTVSGEVEL